MNDIPLQEEKKESEKSGSPMFDICLLARVLARIKVKEIEIPFRESEDGAVLKDGEFREWLSMFMEKLNLDILEMESRMKSKGTEKWLEDGIKTGEFDDEEMIEFRSIAHRLFLHLQWMKKVGRDDTQVAEFLRKSSKDGGFRGLIIMVKDDIVSII